MTEQKRYMEQLDDWTQETILDPLYKAWDEVQAAPDEYLDDAQRDLLAIVGQVKKAVREKVLDSYRNGQKSASGGPQRERREWRGKNKQEK